MRNTAFIKLTIREAAPYGETNHRQAYINIGEIVEITEQQDNRTNERFSHIRLRDGREIDVSTLPEAIIRKIAGVEN